jgi:hypothetical protein
VIFVTAATVRYVMRTARALLLGVAIATAPALALAQHSGGGGGGGHASGGGHFGGGGGGHFGGFSGGHFAGFGGHAYGGHAFAAPHYGVAGHYSGAYGGRYFSPAAHGFAYTGVHGAYAAHPGYVGRPGAVAPHPGVGAAYYYHGGHAWVGGYWHGVYWPHCWYYPGWAWYLPVLPLGYATYWWGGVPYYYWNSLYYTWNPADNGYVVTDPPPAAGAGGSADTNGGDYEQAPQANYSGSGAADLYVYPRNGQTDEQTQNDRYECHAWAVSQSGFDPTRSQQQGGGNPADYRQAMAACLDARGYTTR